MTSDLTPELLLKAYSVGLFPMAESADDPALFWVDPERRGIMPLDAFHVPRSLRKSVRKGEFQAYVYSMATGPDPQAALKCFYSTTPQSACNYTTFKNADFDKLVDEAGQTDDAAKRGQLLQKANALLYDEAPVWFFNYNKAVMAVQPWLKGIQLNATELTHQNVEDLWVDETSPAK